MADFNAETYFEELRQVILISLENYINDVSSSAPEVIDETIPADENSNNNHQLKALKVSPHTALTKLLTPSEP